MEKTDKKLQRVALLTERAGSIVDSFRLWLTQAWKISFLMSKGAYLLSERQALYQKLGREVYYKIRKGEWQNGELEPIVNEIDRMNKKIELEEMQIRRVRYGKRNPILEEDEDELL